MFLLICCPEQSELEFLTDRSVRDSDVLSVEGDFGDYKTVALQVKLLSRLFGSSGLVSMVKDDSCEFLRQMAVSTVQNMAQCIATGRLTGFAEHIFEEISKHENEHKNKLSEPGDFPDASLN